MSMTISKQCVRIPLRARTLLSNIIHFIGASIQGIILAAAHLAWAQKRHREDDDNRQRPATTAGEAIIYKHATFVISFFVLSILEYTDMVQDLYLRIRIVPIIVGQYGK